MEAASGTGSSAVVVGNGENEILDQEGVVEDFPNSQSSGEPAKISPALVAGRFVNDEIFVRQISRYRIARSFLLDEGVRFSDVDVGKIDISHLYNFRFSTGGENVSKADWLYLDTAERALFSYFTPDLKRKFRMVDTRGMIGRWPIGFLVGVLVSFLASVVLPPYFSELNDPFAASIASLGAYLVWTISLGGLGAAAFLAVNSLGIQSDSSFDMGDKALIFMRLVVGSLFGFVLSLPVSLPAFREFSGQALGAASASAGSDVEIGTIALILLPFFLGFSTPLVLAVMSRIITSVETFFGIKQPETVKPVIPVPANG